MQPFNPNESQDRSRMIVAVVVSLAVLLGYHFLVEKPRMEREAAQRQQVEAQQAAAPQAAGKAAVAEAQDALRPRPQVLADDAARVPIRGTRVHGSLTLTGGRIDDLLLDGQYKTVERKENVELLTPTGAAHAYYVESGWVAQEASTPVPSSKTRWHLAAHSPRELTTGGAPVVMEWDNGRGLLFTRSIALDDNYLFTIRQSVKNGTDAPVRLNPYYMTARHGLPEDFRGLYTQHEGPIGVLGGKGKEPSYKDMREGDNLDVENTTGWIGFSDKYWLVALLPEAKEVFTARTVATQGAQDVVYQADIVGAAVTAEAGATAEDVSYVYAGVKDYKVMTAYEGNYGFSKLDFGIDFGMWFFITKPFFWLLHLLYGMTGSIAVTILLMTVVVRACIFPLTQKSFRSMAKMRIVAPKLKELQEKYKDDRAALQAQIFELYKKENVNPFSGCWPMLLQIPIVFALYKVILISIELRHAPFWGWIHDMSAPDPTSVFNLFGLIPWNPPAALMIGAWPVLFCLTMVQLKRISPPMADPAQEKLQAFFPYIVTVLMAHFASGLVIYWTWSNCLTILQQYYMLRVVSDEKTSLLRGHHARRKPKKAKDGA
jgi:YidC/Oxa1 family membrane protein insertase